MKEKFKNSVKSFKNELIENSKFIKRSSIVIIVFVIIFGGFIMNCFVPSESMSPMLEPGQMYIASRMAYIKDSPKRGDIVVFKAPDEEHSKYVKRVIGLPGELVYINNNKVNIDNQNLDEPYLKEKMADGFGPCYIPKKGDEVTLKNTQRDAKGNLVYANCYIGNYYVGNVGAYQENNTGLFKTKRKKIDFLKKYCKKSNGKYIIKEDTYFLMGDNRNNSFDARYWDYTYVKESKIIAKYLFSYL